MAEYERLKDEYISAYDSDHIGYHLHGGGAMRDLDLMQHGDRSFVNGKDLIRFIRDMTLCPCMRIFNGNTCNAPSCPRNLRIFHDMELVIRRSKQSARPIGLPVSLPWPQHLAQYRAGGRFAPPPGKGIFCYFVFFHRANITSIIRYTGLYGTVYSAVRLISSFPVCCVGGIEYSWLQQLCSKSHVPDLCTTPVDGRS